MKQDCHVEIVRKAVQNHIHVRITQPKSQQKTMQTCSEMIKIKTAGWITKTNGKMAVINTNVHGTKTVERALTPFYRCIKCLWRE